MAQVQMLANKKAAMAKVIQMAAYKQAAHMKGRGDPDLAAALQTTV